jgi:hypothetical protein
MDAALQWEKLLVQPLSAGEQEALFKLLDKLDTRVAALETEP